MHGHRFGYVRPATVRATRQRRKLDAPPGQVACPRVGKKRRDGLLVEAEPADHRFPVLRTPPATPPIPGTRSARKARARSTSACISATSCPRRRPRSAWDPGAQYRSRCRFGLQAARKALLDRRSMAPTPHVQGTSGSPRLPHGQGLLAAKSLEAAGEREPTPSACTDVRPPARWVAEHRWRTPRGKLGKLIKEQDAPVSEGDLAGPHRPSASDAAAVPSTRCSWWGLRNGRLPASRPSTGARATQWVHAKRILLGMRVDWAAGSSSCAGQTWSPPDPEPRT